MRKTLAAANRGERVPFKIPRSVQQSIPIQRVWQDGIWQVNGRFSQTWRFADINYSLASYEDQRDMFTSYCGVLNSLPTDAVTKITIHNRRLNSSDFQHSVLMRECGDDLDLYRREYNRVLTEKAAASNNLIQDKYITVSVARKNAEEARAFFHRVDADLSKNLGRLDSGAKALDTYERLRILHDFFRPGEEQFYKFDLNASMRLGHSFKDYIAPDGMKFLSDHFELGGKVGRVLFMRKYSSYIKDDMITSMADFPRTLVLSIDLLPVPTDEAVRDVQSQIMGIESDITRWQQRQNARNNFTAVVPYELEQQRAETKEFLDDLSTRDQRMVYANVTLLHMADTLEQLDADTETLLSKSLCDFSILRYQQEDGFNTALPYLKKNGIDSKTKYNQVANYIYLDTQVNKAISDDAPCDYFSKAFMQCETKAIELGNICNLSQLNENLQENCIPLSVKNMDASSYEEFLTERRKLMAFMMKRYYWSL